MLAVWLVVCASPIYLGTLPSLSIRPARLPSPAYFHVSSVGVPLLAWTLAEVLSAELI